MRVQVGGVVDPFDGELDPFVMVDVLTQLVWWSSNEYELASIWSVMEMEGPSAEEFLEHRARQEVEFGRYAHTPITAWLTADMDIADFEIRYRELVKLIEGENAITRVTEN